MSLVNSEIMLQRALSQGNEGSALAKGLRALGINYQREGSSKEAVKDAYFRAAASLRYV